MRNQILLASALLLSGCSSERAADGERSSPPPALDNGALASVARLRLDKMP